MHLWVNKDLEEPSHPRKLINASASQRKLRLNWATINGKKVASMRNRGANMSAHVLLNLFNELGKRDKMRGLPRILSLRPAPLID